MPPLLDAYPELVDESDHDEHDRRGSWSGSVSEEGDTPDTTLSSICSATKVLTTELKPKNNTSLKPNSKTTGKQKEKQKKKSAVASNRSAATANTRSAEPFADTAVGLDGAPMMNGQRTTRQSVKGRSLANYDMKVHPLDEFQRPAYWKKRHNSLRSSQRGTGSPDTSSADSSPALTIDDNSEEDGDTPEHDSGLDDDFDYDGEPLNVTRVTENQVRAPNPKATRTSTRISSQPYHDYTLIPQDTASHRSHKHGKKRTRSSQASSRKKRKTSHSVVSRIEDVNEEGYHIVFDEFPSTAAWSPWQRVKFPTEESTPDEDDNIRLLSDTVARGSQQIPITIPSDNTASGSSPSNVTAGSEPGGRGEDQPLPALAILQPADLDFRNRYVVDPVAPFAQVHTVNPVDTLHSSSPLSELSFIEAEGPSPLQDFASFFDQQHTLQSIDEPGIDYSFPQYAEDDDDDPAAGPMFSDPCTPTNGLRAQAMTLMDAAHSQTRSHLAENTETTSALARFEVDDDKRSHSSVDRIFEEDAIEAAERRPIERFSRETDFCVVM